jgi:hypothetical protein
LPNCGNELYELLDYSIARCTNCYSLWDPYMYPGFPVPTVEPGEIWDTSEPENDDLFGEENDDDNVSGEQEDVNQESDEIDEGDIEWDEDDEDELEDDY